MYWLFLLLAVAAMAIAFLATSAAVMAVCLLVALALLVAWVMGLYQARVAGHERDVSLMIDPAELRRLREQAEARKAMGEAQSPE